MTITVEVPSETATPTPSAPESSAPVAGELPTTGSNTTLYIGTGVLLVAAGAGALLIARRRKESTVI